MIYSGLCSVTFRKLFPEQLVELAANCGLDGIEWGGDVHVPTSDLAHAEKVGRMTLEAGLKIAAYGSYYRVVASEEESEPFDWMLETAVALGAPVIRVWAGRKGSGEADDEYRKRVIEETRRIASVAEEAGIQVAYEYHANTLTDTNASALALLKEVDHPNLRTYWQPHDTRPPEDNQEGLEAVLPWLSHLHVHHFPAHTGERQRLPLAKGHDTWLPRLQQATKAVGDRFALLEFVCDNTVEQFREDAKALKDMLAAANEA